MAVSGPEDLAPDRLTVLAAFEDLGCAALLS
jgi:hypothetical protein